MKLFLSRLSGGRSLYRRLADAVLLAGVGLSVYGWLASADSLRQSENAAFDAQAAAKVQRVVDYVDRYIDLCESLAAVFHSSVDVDRIEFHQHVRSLRIADRYPALQALQYAARVPREQRAAFEEAVRNDRSLRPEGYPDYRIHPEGDRDEYSPVVFNEPMEGNEAAFGYDHAYDTDRRAVLERARDGARPMISPPLQLVQGSQPTRGLVIRAPVYAHGQPRDTPDERRLAYAGHVSVVVRAADLLRYALADHDASRYGVSVRDIGDQSFQAGEPGGSPQPVFEGADVWTHPYSAPPDADPADLRLNVKAIGGRMWEIAIARRPFDPASQPYPLLVLLGGLLGSAALWVALRVFADRYIRASELAERMSRQARESEARLRNVIDGTADGILTYDEQGRIASANTAALRMFGRAEADMLGRPMSALVPLGDAARGGAAVVFRPGTGGEATGLRSDGRLFPMELSVSAVEFDGARHYVALLRDISERRAAELAIEESQRQLRRADALRRTIYDSAPFAIVATDLRGVIQAINPAAEVLLGYSADELIGRATPVLYHDRQEVAQRASQLAAELGEPIEPGAEVFLARPRRGRPDEREWTVVRKDGRRVPVILVSTSMVSETGEPVGFMGISYDVTERKRAEEHIRHMAHHDALTNLPNRVLLQERLGAALVRARREGDVLALMFIDLDRFKNINDSLGHHVGDAILKIVAERLHAAVRASDTVARMGGDEFVVLLPKVAQVSDCEAVAQKMIAVLGEPMQVGPHLLRVTPSIGVATYPEGGADPATLMRAADAAMYHAKAQGRNAYCMFNESMTRHAAQRLALENDLHEALARGEMHVVYQPQFECRSGRLVGAEALVRWQRGTHGVVSPAEFIPVAEENGLIVPIGAWVLREACAQVRRWEAATGAELRVAVNLSPRQIESADLAERVVATLREVDLPPHRLELEITESAIVRDTLSTATVLARLRALGICIAIDDFGIGYSSLAYLRELPVDKFKIDRSFLSAVPGSASDTRLAAALIAMGHTLQVALVAEGVETPEQLEFLRQHDCHEAQGYHLGRPMNAQAFEDLIRRQGGRADGGVASMATEMAPPAGIEPTSSA